MVGRPRLQFWHEYASTYSYIAAARIGALAAAHDVEIDWRPFPLGPLLFQQQGMKDTPFNVVPVKGRYMWRDMERLCASLELPLQRPDIFPQHTILAARVAIIGVEEGWIAQYAPAVYRANFADNRDISSAATLGPIIASAGGDADAVLARAATDEIKAALRAASEEAMALGIFGAPSFVTGDGELFWGHDRMEAALDWAAAHHKKH
jgi:2-hydroxychromene-2-carboxylate isomerase